MTQRARTVLLCVSLTDASEAAIPDVNVLPRNIATSEGTRTTTTTTDSDGLYIITPIPARTYELTVEKTGFRSASVQSIPLTTRLAATQDVVLDVGSVQQALEASATAVQIKF